MTTKKSKPASKPDALKKFFVRYGTTESETIQATDSKEAWAIAAKEADKKQTIIIVFKETN